MGQTHITQLEAKALIYIPVFIQDSFLRLVLFLANFIYSWHFLDAYVARSIPIDIGQPRESVGVSRGRMARIRTRQVKRRKGTCSLWLKRNWVLVMLIFLALVGVFLSIALFLEPCEKKTRTSITTTNVTLNVTSVRSLHSISAGGR